MTILDKIRKARELVAAMDADKSVSPLCTTRESYFKAADAAIALIRDDELLALGEDARLGRIFMRYIDRLNDPTPEDSLEKIISELAAAIDAAIGAGE